MQVWLSSDDPILVAEAQQFFAAPIPNEKGTLSQTDAIEPEQPEGCPLEGMFMPGGFGTSQSKQRRGGKTALKEVRQLRDVPQQPTQELEVDLAMQAEVEAFFAQYQQEHPEDLALAWSAGVYNPLDKVDLLAVGARFLKPEEEDWLALARMVEWLDVEDDLDAIYFTAPPPDFALEQADWYVRPDLSSFLEEPVLLREVIQRYPIPLEVIQGAVNQRFLQLGWTSQQQAQFILKLLEKPQTELTQDEWTFLLFELDSRVQSETEHG
jgi:hypothetical protein